MTPHSFWRGYLKLSLVTCAVALVSTVSDSEKVRFHTLNRATGHRVRSRYIDAATGRAVADSKLAMGYERGENEYLLLEDEELESIALESSRTIDVEKFVERDAIDWVWYDTPYFLVPDDTVGVEAYAVIREAMARSGKAGLSRLVLHRRERPVMLVPRGTGIVLWTLRYAAELRKPVDDGERLGGKAPAAARRAMEAALAELKTPWSDDLTHDPVQDRLLEIIAAKKKAARRPKAKRAAEPAGNIVDLTDALRRSLRPERS